MLLKIKITLNLFQLYLYFPKHRAKYTEECIELKQTYSSMLKGKKKGK